jgi:hypothetical protein
MGITTDSASKNDTFFQALEVSTEGKISAGDVRINCTAHILNLSVQDVLSALSSRPANSEESDQEDNETGTFESEPERDIESTCVSKLRRMVRAFKSSPQRCEKIAESCQTTSKN